MFERQMPKCIANDGFSRERLLMFGNGSILRTEGGEIVKDQVKLLFGKGTADRGWWVNPRTLAELIAELLYIRGDLIDHINKLDMVVEDDGPGIEVVDPGQDLEI
jgi:hypothetical protein